MDDADFARLSAEILDGNMPDWDALEREAPPEQRGRLDALRAIAQVAAVSRDALRVEQVVLDEMRAHAAGVLGWVRFDRTGWPWGLR